jgi:hypothetical protein
MPPAMPNGCRTSSRDSSIILHLHTGDHTDGGQFVTKLARLFRRDLEVARDTGKLLGPLRGLLVELFGCTRPDTQAVEGVNSMLRRMLNLAPHLSVELLSSRLIIKKALAAAGLPEPSGSLQAAFLAEAEALRSHPGWGEGGEHSRSGMAGHCPWAAPAPGQLHARLHPVKHSSLRWAGCCMREISHEPWLRAWSVNLWSLRTGSTVPPRPGLGTPVRRIPRSSPAAR